MSLIPRANTIVPSHPDGFSQESSVSGAQECEWKKEEYQSITQCGRVIENTIELEELMNYAICCIFCGKVLADKVGE